jgi:hypothetical protein
MIQLDLCSSASVVEDDILGMVEEAVRLGVDAHVF